MLVKLNMKAVQFTTDITHEQNGASSGSTEREKRSSTASNKG